MFWLKLALLLAVFQLPLGAIGYLAYKSGYLIDTPAQAQKREPEYRNHPKILKYLWDSISVTLSVKI